MKPLNRLFSRRSAYKIDKRLSSEIAPSAPSQLVQQDGVVMLGNVLVLFGLDWTTAGANQTHKQFLESERKRGRKCYVDPAGSDMVGFSELRPRSSLHSAAVYLSETVSRGESEFFVFDLTDSGTPSVAGVVALVDRLPIPGFDCICSHREVSNLLTDFWGLQPNSTVRVAGTLKSIEGIEQIKPGKVFDGDLDVARMSGIPNPAVRWLQLLGILILGVASGLGYLWNQERHAQELATQQDRIPDPNVAYEEHIASQLQSIGPSGSVMMRSWLGIIANLPRSLKGWELDKITCVPAECTTTWRTLYGSYDDLLSSDHPGLDTSTARLQFLDSLERSHVEFRHPVPQRRLEMVRDTLPSVSEAQREFGSVLQDHSLLGAKEAQLSDVSLFGGNDTDIGPINKPVVKGGFSIGLPFASIQDFRLPHYCVPTLMEVEFPPDTNGRFNNVFFNIRGDFYAKGKAY